MYLCGWGWGHKLLFLFSERWGPSVSFNRVNTKPHGHEIMIFRHFIVFHYWRRGFHIMTFVNVWLSSTSLLLNNTKILTNQFQRKQTKCLPWVSNFFQIIITVLLDFFFLLFCIPSSFPLLYTYTLCYILVNISWWFLTFKSNFK